MVTKREPLRVVADSETRSKPFTVREAADSGTRRDLLVALRARIATDTDSPLTPARDLAALSRRLLEIAREIEAIDAHDEGDEVGDAAATPDEVFAAT
jgi:hypothetical protein